MSFITAPIIATHHSPLIQKFGTPRQPNLVDVSSHIIMHPPFDTYDAFVGIEQHSHLWLLWQFHHNRPQANFRPQVRPPRLGGNDKMGVFATRSMYRPAGLGLSVVRLIDIYHTNGHGVILKIVGADMIDGTPIIDIKPYLPYSDSITHALSPVHTPPSKKIHISQNAKLHFDQHQATGHLSDEDITIIGQLIAQDPRPAYRQTQTNQHFTMRYGNIDVVFFMNEMGMLIIDKAVLVL